MNECGQQCSPGLGGQGPVFVKNEGLISGEGELQQPLGLPAWNLRAAGVTQSAVPNPHLQGKTQVA